MRSILIEHNQRYPLWSVDDLYKLVYQAAMGSEHAVRDERAAGERLADEIAALGPGPQDPLADPISPDGQILRIHLRPFVQQGLNADRLLAAFIRTARDFQGQKQNIRRYGGSACEVALEGLLPIAPEEVEQAFADMEAGNFPPVHHSPLYEEHYRPAYRVVARDFVSEMLGDKWSIG